MPIILNLPTTALNSLLGILPRGPVENLRQSEHTIIINSFRLDELDDLRSIIKALEEQRSAGINDRCRRDDHGAEEDVSVRKPGPPWGRRWSPK